MKKIRTIIILLLAFVAIFIIYEIGAEEPDHIFSGTFEAVQDFFSDIRSGTRNNSIEITATSTFSEKRRDIEERNPSDWEMTDWASEPATDRLAPGGTSTEEEWTHIATGLRIYRHDVRTVEGTSIHRHPHWRPYPTIIGRGD